MSSPGKNAPKFGGENFNILISVKGSPPTFHLFFPDVNT